MAVGYFVVMGKSYDIIWIDKLEFRRQSKLSVSRCIAMQSSKRLLAQNKEAYEVLDR